MNSGFWRRFDPETGELNCVKWVKDVLEFLQLQQERLRWERQRLLAEAKPE